VEDDDGEPADFRDSVCQGIRYLDRLVDEPTKGKPLAKILRA
jgi:hypothetical protein